MYGLFIIVALVAASIAAITTANYCARTFLMRYIIIIIIHCYNYYYSDSESPFRPRTHTYNIYIYIYLLFTSHRQLGKHNYNIQYQTTLHNIIYVNSLIIIIIIYRHMCACVCVCFRWCYL